MTGFKYWRLKRRMTVRELARQSGCCAGTIQFLERTATDTTSSYIVAALAEVLGVPMEEFLATYPDDALSAGDHPTRSARRANTVLGRYRAAHNLTYDELATRLGLRTKQHAKILCEMSNPSIQYLRRLAEYEHHTVAELIQRYKGGE